MVLSMALPGFWMIAGGIASGCVLVLLGGVIDQIVQGEFEPKKRETLVKEVGMFAFVVLWATLMHIGAR